MTLNRKIKRGIIKKVFNSTFKEIDYYRKTSRGLWVLTNPFNNTDSNSALKLSKHQIKKLELN